MHFCISAVVGRGASPAANQRSEVVGQAFSPSGRRLRAGSLPADPINSGKRERLPYSSLLLALALGLSFSQSLALSSQRLSAFPDALQVLRSL